MANLEDLTEKDSGIYGYSAAEDDVSHPSLPEPTHEEIAVAAYQIYLSRGTGEGGEVKDWLQAERELLERAEAQRPKAKSTTA
ncbi:MAG: DUF2934 domain-containing protein [Candidatus Acidiferrales bacterium]|jgi:glutamate synthase domain-containing protein 2